MKNIIKIVMVIIGTLIGAGFASGREIYLFFGKYGSNGQIGIIISSIFTGIIIYSTLKIISKEGIISYTDLLEDVNPKHKNTNNIIKIIVIIFQLISFYIMVAGFSAYMKQTYELPVYLSSIVFVLISYFIFRKSLQGMVKANTILVPILLIFIIYLGIKNMPYAMQIAFTSQNSINEKGWLISSILYTSYNSIILIPVLVTMKKYIKSKSQIIGISTISVLSIMILSFCIYGLLLKGNFFVQELELPLIEITHQFGKIFSYMYGFVIIVSIFTSAISTGYSFLENICKDEKSYKRNLIFMSITSILVSNIGFSNLVNILYPLFGILGMIQIIFICINKNKYNI